MEIVSTLFFPLFVVFDILLHKTVQLRTSDTEYLKILCRRRVFPKSSNIPIVMLPTLTLTTQLKFLPKIFFRTATFSTFLIYKILTNEMEKRTYSRNPVSQPHLTHLSFLHCLHDVGVQFLWMSQTRRRLRSFVFLGFGVLKGSDSYNIKTHQDTFLHQRKVVAYITLSSSVPSSIVNTRSTIRFIESNNRKSQKWSWDISPVGLFLDKQKIYCLQKRDCSPHLNPVVYLPQKI